MSRTGSTSWSSPTLSRSRPCTSGPFNEARAIEIALIFDWRAFHALNVARRLYENGMPLFYMDGGHRLVGAQLAYNDKVKVPCLIYDVGSVQEEARIYNLVNINRRGLQTADKWLSRHTEGDPYVETVEKLLGEWGLRAAPKRGSTAPEPGDVVAVTRLEYALKKAGEQSIREVLGNLHAVFGDNPKGYLEHFLSGTWHFIIRFPDYRPSRLRTVLLRKGLEWRPEFSGMDEGVSMALSIHQAYNKQENPEYRLPPFPLTPRGHQSGQETTRAARCSAPRERRRRTRGTAIPRSSRSPPSRRKDSRTDGTKRQHELHHPPAWAAGGPHRQRRQGLPGPGRRRQVPGRQS